MNEKEVVCQGSSMRFLIARSGDRARFVRTAPDDLAFGDIVIFLEMRRQGTPTPAIHRLVWKGSRDGALSLWTKGDSNASLDPEMPASAFIGKVVAIKNGARPWRSTVDARGRLRHLAIGAVSNAAFGFLHGIRRTTVEILIRLSRRPTPGLRGARRVLTEALVFSETLLSEETGTP